MKPMKTMTVFAIAAIVAAMMTATMVVHATSVIDSSEEMARYHAQIEFNAFTKKYNKK
jgi:hypothetical protein